MYTPVTPIIRRLVECLKQPSDSNAYKACLNENLKNYHEELANLEKQLATTSNQLYSCQHQSPMHAYLGDIVLLLGAVLFALVVCIKIVHWSHHLDWDNGSAQKPPIGLDRKQKEEIKTIVKACIVEWEQEHYGDREEGEGGTFVESGWGDASGDTNDGEQGGEILWNINGFGEVPENWNDQEQGEDGSWVESGCEEEVPRDGDAAVVGEHCTGICRD